MQIRSRLTVQFTLLVSLILLVTLVSIYLLAKYTYESRFYDRIEKKALTTVHLLLNVDKIDSVLLKQIQLKSSDVYFGENIEIFDSNFKMIYTNNDTLFFDTSPSLFYQIDQNGSLRFSQGDYDIIGIEFRNHDNTKYIILAGGIDDYGTSRLIGLRKIILVLFFSMTLIAAFIGWGYSNRALKPINLVIKNIRNLSTIDLSQRLTTISGKDEIGKLVAMFNQLLERIEQSFALQKTFLTNVSHELKNPLTKITSQLEVTLLKDRTLEEYKALIQSLLEDVKELNQLSVSLLDLTSLEQKGIILEMTKLRIDQILWEVRETIEELHPHYKVNIDTSKMPESEESLFFFANQNLIKTALINLTENACKFSSDHSASITFLSSSERLEIKIADNGIGISNDDLKNIFEPFFRSRNSSKIKGHGIGLSICLRIIELHKGTLQIESLIGKGTTAIVSFIK